MERKITKELLLDNIFNMFPEGIFWKDSERKFLGANQIFLDYYGFLSVDDIIGKTDEDMGWHIDPEPFKRIEENILNTGKPHIDMMGECLVNGDLRKLKVSKFPIKDKDGTVIGLIGSFRDVTEEIAEKERLFNLSHRDELTGLFNRRAYTQLVKQYEAQFELAKQDFALLMTDLNDFKNINDTYGHEFGNEVLKSVCASIKDVVRETGLAFRYGGDEFVILHKIKNAEEVDSLKFKILQAIRTPKFIDGVKMNIDASVGSEIYSNAHSIPKLIENADKKMYTMKQNKKKAANEYRFGN